MRMRSLLLLFGLLAVACTSKKAEAPAEKPKAPASTTEARSAPEIRAEEVSYQVGDTTLKGYIAWDAAKTEPRPGILVVHEWWGHNEYVRRRARMLAEEGYTALALDMYGDGKQAAHPEDAQKFMMEAISNAEVAGARFDAALDLLQKHASTDPEKTAAIGYCFGGAVVLHMARFGKDLGGVVSFHGNLGTETPAKPGAIEADILVLHGADDPFVPKEQVEAFKKEMEVAGANYVFIEYPGAMHAFTNPEATATGKKFDLPLAYDAKADEQSWEELQRFLKALFDS
jgi:dienelactone hydrolase